jgi:hypothetical protein
MRLFRQLGGSNRRNRRKQATLLQTGGVDPAEASIGSELAASDQFEILVANKAAGSISNHEHRRKKQNSFLSYFSSENDDSTVSSITTGDYGGFFQGKKSYYNPSSAAQSLSSLCCCGESNNTAAAGTNRTFPSSTDNTLIQSSTYGTVQPTDSRSQQYYRSQNGSRCCGPQDYSVNPNGSRRPFFFSSYWGRSRNHNKRLPSSTPPKNMSASLFDNLSEDEVDIDIQRSYSFGGGSRRGGTGKNSCKPVSLRRVLTWKRRA